MSALLHGRESCEDGHCAEGQSETGITARAQPEQKSSQFATPQLMHVCKYDPPVTLEALGLQVQVPPEQMSPGGHVVPHAPQLAGSLLVKLQLPAQQLPPSPHAVLSATGAHAPVAGLQVLQSPQDTPAHGSGVFVGVSVDVGVSVGVAVSTGVAVFVGVAATHEPPMQLAPTLHTFPHPPQLFASVAKLVHTDGWDPPKQQSESPAGQTASL
jgi:hypothetical protein